jgi:hypothetical protein
MAAEAPAAEDVLVLPIRSGHTVWGALLATPQVADRLLTPAEHARLLRMADVLGRRIARWQPSTNGRTISSECTTPTL